MVSALSLAMFQCPTKKNTSAPLQRFSITNQNHEWVVVVHGCCIHCQQYLQPSVPFGDCAFEWIGDRSLPARKALAMPQEEHQLVRTSCLVRHCFAIHYPFSSNGLRFFGVPTRGYAVEAMRWRLRRLGTPVFLSMWQ